MLSKIKSIKLSNYFQIIKPKYVYLQIKPHKSTRNYNSTNIAKAILYTYKAITKRIRVEEKKLVFETNFKISYVIDIDGGNTNFYFIVPEIFLNIIVEKVREIWPKVELNFSEPIKEFNGQTIYYKLNYKKEDALSLQVDKKSNEPLNSILNVMEIMQSDDRVTIIYNFLPKSQYSWNKTYNKTMEKIKNFEPIERDKTSVEYIVKSTLGFMNYLVSSILYVFSDFLGGTKETNTAIAEILLASDVLEANKRLSPETKLKKDKSVLDAQILVCSSSEDKTRQNNNVLSVCQAYRSVDLDNELVGKIVKIDKGIDLETYKFSNVETNTFSVDECQNFIQQPGRLLMRTLGIQHVQVNENPVPKQLREGYIRLGSVKVKGDTYDSFIEDDYNIGSLPLIPVGAQGAGKSTFIANYYRFVNSRKEGGLVIDFIKNCELSDEIISYIPKEDLIVLDYTNENDIQGFAFNEFEIKKEMSTFERLRFANLQAQQLIPFIDSINIEQPLQARMRKYLSSAANVIFATGETSLKEVIECLEDCEKRFIYINKLSKEEKEYLIDEIKALLDLNEYSKPTKTNSDIEIIGTKLDRIEGILDRVSLLKEDFSLKHMFNKGGKKNINFVKELENGKIIIVKMPQDSFKKHAKNVITTFLLSKVWIATEIRGKWNNKPKKTHVSIDEIFQSKTAMRMLANDEVLPQTRKFGCKFILSCQYTEQINILMDTLIGAGASFMLMRGTSEKDFKLFENKLENFEYEDLRDMDKYNSLNLIYYSGGYSSFISKLPPPIKQKIS